MILKEKKR